MVARCGVFRQQAVPSPDKAGRPHFRRPLACAVNILFYLIERKASGGRINVVNERFRAIRMCVFFTQHSFEKRRRRLCARRFFVAPKGSMANVRPATEGASPGRAFQVDGWLQRVGPAIGRIDWVGHLPGCGELGEVPTVLSHWTDTEPSHDKQSFGGSK